MAADDFFARWSKRKTQEMPLSATSSAAALAADNAPAAPADAPQAAAALQPKPLPTLADVEGLTAESDYAAFVAKGVDETVKRSAMKKLFALPQFNIMDGLDIYTGDYSQPDPLPPGMLEALVHARDALDPAQFFAKPVSQLLDRVTEPPVAAAHQPEPLSSVLDDAVEGPGNPAPALPQDISRPDPEPAGKQPDTAETSEIHHAQNKNGTV